jgi:exopolysaccharide production protein ExoQ
MPARRTWLLSEPAVEFAAAFGAVLPLLFVMQLGSKGPALFILVALAYGFYHRRWLIPLLLQRWFLLIVPALFLISVLWSDYPRHTVKHALEAAITIAAGLALSASPRPKAVVIGYFAAFAVFLLASVAFGGFVAQGSLVTGDYTQRAFAGLNGSKNLMGTQAGMAIIVTIAAIWVIARSGNLAAFLGAIAVLAVETYALVAARSAGSLIGVAVSLAGFMAIATIGRMPRGVRGLFTTLFGLVVVLFVAFTEKIIDASTAFVLHLFNKDPTFTGRSYLWYRAHDFIAEHPLLGRGYEAFWVQGNIDAEGLWQFALIKSRFGFNFHNTLLEMLVHLGWVGTVALLGVFVVAALMVLRRTAAFPSLPAAFYAAYLLFTIVRAPYESLMPSPVEFSTVILFTALGFGFRPIPKNAAAFRRADVAPAWTAPPVSYAPALRRGR